MVGWRRPLAEGGLLSLCGADQRSDAGGELVGLVEVGYVGTGRGYDGRPEVVGDPMGRLGEERGAALAASEHDLVARNGGDEFCIVFTETDKATAIERADHLQRRVVTIETARLRPQPTGAGDDLRITASIGVAAFPPDASTANDLLEQADAAMYHTKRTGRNGVSYRDANGELVRKEGIEPACIQAG